MKSAGRHLIIDATLSSKSKSIVSSTQLMSEYLEKITNITGMTLVIPPIAMKFPFAGETQRLINDLDMEGVTSPVIEQFKQHILERDTEQGGVSAITVWLESHASLHSWPNDDYISIDLYSCKTFDFMPVLEFTKSFMKLSDMNVIIVDRKMNGPAELKQIGLSDLIYY